MVESATAIRRIVNLYRERLLSRHIIPERIVLFGSYANGSANEDSDIDIAVVSPAFGKGSAVDEQVRLSLAKIGVDLRLSPLPVSLERWASPSPTDIVSVIQRSGTTLWPEPEK